MKKKVKITAILLLTTVSIWAQNKDEEQMKTRTINPWKWQNERSYVQAVEVTQAHGTLYVSGQTAIDANGISSTADMKTQLIEALENLDKVIEEAGYENKNIVRLNIYTTSTEELFTHFKIFQDWIAKNNIKQSSTVLEVKSLFETLKVELEATVVK
ncbi:2-iminobutanoate/2-iminopropanoate deaminase [Pedobacter sp. UYP30]|uniref:RidA family protein n=1 Tax=Pedobacter sp. UYP30 TaxID=1756400 RepID=UPI003395F694